MELITFSTDDELTMKLDYMYENEPFELCIAEIRVKVYLMAKELFAHDNSVRGVCCFHGAGGYEELELPNLKGSQLTMAYKDAYNGELVSFSTDKELTMGLNLALDCLSVFKVHVKEMVSRHQGTYISLV